MLAEIGTDIIRRVSFARQSSREQLQQLAKLVDGAKLRPHVGAVYLLAETKRAFADKEGGRVKGKVIHEP